MGEGFKEKRPNLKVYTKKSALPTFNDIANKDAIILTQIYSQCIMSYSKRPQRFTTPHGAVITTMTWGLTQPGDVHIDYATYILDTVVKAKNKDPKYIGGGEVLTRIIYEAIGKSSELNRGPSQNIWLQ